MSKNSKSLNAKYLAYLAAYPLITKSVTSGVFLGLNEIISSVVTGEFQKSTILGQKVHHVLSPKLVTMIIYGSLIATPLSHNLYKIINTIFKPPLSSGLKVLQILTLLSTVTPLLAATFTSWVSLLNGYKSKGGSVSEEISRAFAVIKAGLKSNYRAILKSSLITSSVSLVIAQKFILPELWVVFFNFVYFIVGTLQNIKLKKAQKLARARAEKDKKDE
ncbi:uncharacterized protein CANTADRAFT_44216 [Suhomyces tanzawaensis NRRL Y-17324]|uniref:Uncharacterized protein n=1 Tax=Suhomyces tanzawaensis NRRL Y-17324 TaxID=984487 RepID=A0A1E4SPX6_9ASCO|nr:uncharacterized protein CANTADRAFT_44216 [Suhomyces tanzawaensis NRRL Y-17324]ODV81462.1 hypothetical protein CANTADRAFT_44216 [Suhomyces tanzawaensis NRRL Y-17324]